jgi:hypothetical protein
MNKLPKIRIKADSLTLSAVAQRCCVVLEAHWRAGVAVPQRYIYAGRPGALANAVARRCARLAFHIASVCCSLHVCIRSDEYYALPPVYCVF